MKINIFLTNTLKLVFLLGFFPSILLSQNAEVPDAIPSTDALSNGKADKFNVSLYTGKANISLPLFDLKANSRSLSVSLGYDASGVNARNHPGWVGQNWMLSAGGVITRTTNGLPDEYGMTNGPEYSNYNLSYIEVIQDGDFVTPQQTSTVSNLQALAFSAIQNNTALDYAADIFNFNFMGFSGSFFLDWDGQWKVISESNIKVEFDINDNLNYIKPFIEYMPNTNNTKRYQHVIKGFTLIDAEGYRYTFGRYNTNYSGYTGENAIEYSIPFFYQYSWVQGQPNFFNEWSATAWHLTKVEDFNSNIIFELKYARDYFTAQLYNTFEVKETFCADPDGTLHNHGSTTQQEAGNNHNGSLNSNSYLTEIKSNTGEHLEFVRSDATQKKFEWPFHFQYYTSFILCPLIDCPLNYPYPFLQYSGYYSFDPNAALNNPINGLMWKKLDKIIYRRNYTGTGQYIINGVSLQYNNNINERLKLEAVHFTDEDILSDPNAEKLSYVFDYENFSQLPEYLTRQFDHFGYYDGTNDYRPASYQDIYNFTLWENNYYPSRESNFNYANIGQLKSMTLPTGGRIEYDFELHTYSNALDNSRQNLVSDVGQIGGLRIKEIRSYDAGASNYSERKRYVYNQNYQSGGTASSGILSIKPKYVWPQWNLNTAWSNQGYAYYESVMSENNILPLANLFENHITYREVAEVNEDNSYTIFTFVSHEDIKDQLPYTTLIPGYSPYSNFTEMGFYRGQVKSVQRFASDNVLVHKTENIYDISSIINSSEYGITTDVTIDYVCSNLNYNYAFFGSARKIFHKKLKLLFSTETNYFSGLPFSTQTTYSYDTHNDNGNILLFQAKQEVQNSNGVTYATEKKYSFNHASGYTGQQSLLNTLSNQNRLIEVVSLKKVNNTLVDGSEILFEPFNGTTILPQTIKTYDATWDSNNTLSGTWNTSLTIQDYDLTFLKVKTSTKDGWIPETRLFTTRGYLSQKTSGIFSQYFSYNVRDLMNIHTNSDLLENRYFYDKFGRLNESKFTQKNLITYTKYHFPTTAAEKAYIKSKTVYPMISGSGLDSIVHIAYQDGLGRPIQSINKYGGSSPVTDVISKTNYDDLGRPYQEYQPIGVDNNHGAYYTGTFGGGHTETLYYSDPLDRVSQVTPPAWYATTSTYSTNTTSLTDPEGTVYPAQSLMVHVVTDPDNNITETYADKIGRVVRTMHRKASDQSSTWTIYDDKNRPVRVYPPGTTTSTPNLIYVYRYDGEDNLIYRKVPDAGAEQFRYSVRNLMTASQNAVLAAQGKWLVTHYDDYGRPSNRGYHNGSDPGNTETPTIHTLLEEYFYDGYNGSTTNGAPIYKGKLKKSRIKVLEDAGTDPHWVETEYSYDNYGRVSTEALTNHLGNPETITYTYDMADNLLTETRSIGGANGVPYIRKYDYDHQGRKIKERININTQGEINLAECSYDHKSQLKECNLGRFATSGIHQHLQSLDYTYNAQGWLTGINTLYAGFIPTYDPCDGGPYSTPTAPDTDSDTDAYDLFAEVLNYTTAPGGSGVGQNHNGNITSMTWWHRDQYNQNYSYIYDYLNRVKEARHGEIAQGNYTLKNDYKEKFQYDIRGNITDLDRRGLVRQNHIADNCYQPATIDSLTYTYAPGTNKLVQVTDKALCPDYLVLPEDITRDMTYAANQEIRASGTHVYCDVSVNLYAPTVRIQDTLLLHGINCTPALVQAYPGPCPSAKYTEGFNQQSATGQYTYDTGGNMTYDPNKKLTFYYNFLNLPYKIVGAQGDALHLIYGADGTLHQRKYIQNSVIKDKIDYLRGVEYQSDMPQSIYHSYGRNILQGAYWEPEYHIKDHLGNVRVTFCDENGNGQITGSERRSINDYYAYGMEWNNRYELSDTIEPGNKYRYNGKELFTEMDMDMLNYGARMMDPQLGRMMQPDPRAESFASITPYQYGLNNPILNIDPTGMYTQSYIKKADGTREYTIPSAGYNAEMDRYEDNDDIIDIDKQTGSVTITQSAGNDVVRMVNDGKVESSYIYGQNGSFTAENKLVTGMEGQAILSTNSTKANQFFEFAANANVEFGIVDLKAGVSIVTTSHESGQTSTLPGIVKQFSKLGEIGIRQAHSHPATITHYNESVPSGYYDDIKGNSGSLMPDLLTKGKPYGDAANAIQVKSIKGFENTKFEVYAPGNKTKTVYDGVNKAKIEKY